MIIEEAKPYISELLAKEPWRNNDGQRICDGALDWDGGDLWACTSCGRIGVSTFTMHTRPIVYRIIL